MTGLWIALAAVVLALGFGGYRALTDGTFRGTRRVSGGAEPAPAQREDTPGRLVETAVADVRLGERATLVQFSSAFCAPCRATRRTLSEIAQMIPGVTHLEIDAEHHLALVRRLDVSRTPTTLILDAQGQEQTRAAGAPRKEQVLTALSVLL